MEILFQKIENGLHSRLPMKFGITFDKWSKGAFPLLAIQPIPYHTLNETDHQITTAAHREFIIST